MATAAVELPLSDTTDIAVVVSQDHSVVLFDQEKFDAWYDRLKANAPKDVDVTTNKGRDILRSYAADIRKEKAAIDRDRLKLTKEWRDLTAKVNEAGKTIEQRLDNLADEVRKPLTEWEDAEKARVALCREWIEDFKHDAIVRLEDTADDVRKRGSFVFGRELDPAMFGDMLPEAEAAKSQAVETLKAALVRLTKEEADRAELEKLRAEAAERDAREQAEREAREAEELAAAEAKAAEERKAAAEKAEADKIAQAARDAEQKIRDEAAAAQEAAEAKRRYARQIIAHIQEVGRGMIGGKTYPYGILIRELEEKIEINDDLGDMQGEVAAIRDATLTNVKDAMERQAERTRREEEQEKARQEAEEAHARAESKAHRTAVMKAAKEAIMTCGADEETAKKIVLLIRSGEVPNVSLAF